MGGISRFLEQPSPWRYSKAEGLQPGQYRQFMFVLTSPDIELPGFQVVHMEQGFDRVSLRPPFFRHADKIAVQRRQVEAAVGRQKPRRDDFEDL